ncbi:MAG: hypothetical protein OXK82_08150 [Deltaproteobacteria bacterium]|nr:hypothetical protein [Deltaproteobacteria bacterium]
MPAELRLEDCGELAYATFVRQIEPVCSTKITNHPGQTRQTIRMSNAAGALLPELSPFHRARSIRQTDIGRQLNGWHEMRLVSDFTRFLRERMSGGVLAIQAAVAIG